MKKILVLSVGNLVLSIQLFIEIYSLSPEKAIFRIDEEEKERKGYFSAPKEKEILILKTKQLKE